MKKLNSICIIDDDPVHTFTTKQIIKSQKNFCDTIIVFKDGKEGFDGLKTMLDNKEELPDLILLDINMPIWDGWDFLNEFTKLSTPKKIIIYIVSSSNHPDDIDKAKQYKLVDNFIIKPVTIDKLYNLLNVEE